MMILPQRARSAEIVAGFWERVDKTSCAPHWIWTGECDHEGYALFHVPRLKDVRAHLYARAILGLSPVPRLLHDICPFRHCVNPDCWKEPTGARHGTPKLVLTRRVDDLSSEELTRARFMFYREGRRVESIGRKLGLKPEEQTRLMRQIQERTVEAAHG